MISDASGKLIHLLRAFLVAVMACGLLACGARGKPFAVSSPPPNHSLIHVYRPQRAVGGANRWYLSANGVRLTTVTNGGYFTYEAAPGNVTFSVKQRPSPEILYFNWYVLLLGEEELITIPVEPNHVYYVRFSMGSMELVDASTGEAEIATCRRSSQHRRARSSVLTMRLVALLCALLLVGCSTARVPLVYDYPMVSGGIAKVDEDTVAVEDRREDSSLDRYIAGGMPATIEHIVERELAARRQIAHDPSAADAKPTPLHLQIQLSETSVEIPKKDGMTAAMITSILLFGILAMPAFEHSNADVIGRVQMRVLASTPTSGALCEDIWQGKATLKTPWSHVDNSQTYAKALGAAVKDAMSHLPSTVRCVGVAE